ncbi:MAG: sigma-70 family RNA polymerase sigma factor [Acidimicrobiales bacterium]
MDESGGLPPTPDLAAAATGDWASTEFSSFFQVAYPEATRLARRMGLTAHDAEDVAVEALTRTFVSWGRLQHADWKRPWVTRVVANLVIDQVRRRRAPAAPATASAFEDRSDDGIDLSRALAKLPRRQRQVAVLRYLSDLSIEDVATALQMRPGTVKQHTARAKAALRAELGEPEDPERGRRLTDD